MAVEVTPTIRWTHFVFGSAVLLPWNVMITAMPYFLSQLEGSSLQHVFPSYLSLIFTASNFGFLAHATATAKQSSPSRRVFLGAAALTVTAFLLTVSTFTHPPAALFFVFVQVMGIVGSGAGSYYQTAILAIASLFGVPAMQAVVSGQGAVGVAVSGIQLLSALASVNTSPARAPIMKEKVAETRSAFVFFALSTGFYVFSAGAYAWLMRTPEYREINGGHMTRRISISMSQSFTADGEGDSLVSGRPRAGTPSPVVRTIAMIKTNLAFNFTVAWVFIVTLSVFPPITVSVLPMDPTTNRLIFSSLHFFVFNVGDFLGRLVCSWPPLIIWSGRRLVALSLFRTLFIPAFLLCNVQSPLSTDVRYPVISSDWMFMLILLAFGWSNGYVSTLGLIASASVEHNPRLKGRREDVDVAATVASFCLVGGLTVGSLISFAVSGVLCQCNPFS
ncbi:hypothetical protein BDM02DRAFT_3098783 [Thelephora ganbajun]|uniref:Uncharacterized protein n=1 Tax=Thelephora ganbajun TaxID=370292 RepID=A0ACB6ZC15_THEGA|nr:hypothetical protein BDM02DRAFT_3098783 [Thelephora ganbajun]